MIIGLGKHHTFVGNNLHRGRISATLCPLHSMRGPPGTNRGGLGLAV